MSINGQAELNSLVATSLTLLDRLNSDLANNTKTPNSNSPLSSSSPFVTPTSPIARPDVFGLAKDGASLIRALSTKLSLLVINEPFTPSAITSVVRALVDGALLTLTNACQHCDPALYTRIICEDLVRCCASVLRALRALLVAVPTDGCVLVGAARESNITATGILWAQCDELQAFASRGFGGNLVHRVAQWCAQLQDALQELKEWKEELVEGNEDDDKDDNNNNDDDDDDDDDDHDEGPVHGHDVENDPQEEHIESQQAMLDDLMDVQTRLPPGDPDKIRLRLDATLHRLRLTTSLYQAVVKRRLKPLGASLPAGQTPRPDAAATTGQQTGTGREAGAGGSGGKPSSTASRLDAALLLCKRIPEQLNELAFAFYNLDTVAIDPLMDQCFLDAFALAALLSKPLAGGAERDQFSDWADAFHDRIRML